MKKTYSIFDAFKDDQTRQWSFSRISGAVLLFWVLYFATVLVYRNGTVTDELYKVFALFVGYTTAAYGLNKGISHFNRSKNYDIEDKEA